jgi:hypothetical protein
MWYATWIFKIIFKWRKMTWHELMWHTCMLRELKLMTYSKSYKYKYIWLAFTHDLYKCVDFFLTTLHILYLWQLLDHVIVTQKCIIYAKGLQSSMEFRHSHHLDPICSIFYCFYYYDHLPVFSSVLDINSSSSINHWVNIGAT